MRGMRVRDTLLIFGLILILASVYYFQQVGNPILPVSLPGGNNDYNEPNESQGYVPDTGTEKNLSICDQTCIDFCETHPNTQGPPWDQITPPGSTKNCKTIIEEELGIPDLSTCEECKCMCFSG